MSLGLDGSLWAAGLLAEAARDCWEGTSCCLAGALVQPLCQLA